MAVRNILLRCQFLAILLLLHYTLSAEEFIGPEEEAPEALFEFEVGDAEVDFYLAGTWRASLFGSAGLLVYPDGSVVMSPFPGLEVDRLFQQVPDLTFSVWLLNRFFLEASLIGDFFEGDYSYFDQNYILMGYIGAEDEFLKRVLIGNRDVGIDPYPFIDVPEAGLSSLGAMAEMGTETTNHQLLLRYDNNEPGDLTFIGKNLVSEQVLPLSSYARGRFFKLPDANVDNLKVYIQDPEGSYSGVDVSSGDIYRYRLATVDDAVLSSENGTVFLKESAEGGVLVYYRVGAAEVGAGSLGSGALAGVDATVPIEDKIDLDETAEQFQWGDTYLGQEMDDRQVIVDGDTCLRLYRPGEFSPFEILASYPVEDWVPEDLARLRVSIVKKGNPNATVASKVAFRLAPGADYIRAYYRPVPGLRDSFRNLYPFLDENDGAIFDPDNLLYGPLADPRPGYLKQEILVSRLTPVDEYRIGEDVVPGSVQILRNGVAETRFEVDYEQGRIDFLTEIAPDDRLVVSFRRKVSLAGNGDLLFAWGNTLNFSEALELKLATGVRWNFLPGSYTDEAYSRTGSVLLSAGAEGQAGPLAYSATLGGAYTNPDTTGIMRLLSMESTGVAVPLSEDTAYPASPPNGDDNDVPLDTLTKANRGRLIYKDYRSYGALGTSTLQDYEWPVPDDQVYEYETGSKPGPYLVAGSSEGLDEGQSLALDFELDDGDWAGTQIPVTFGGGVSDLSTAQGISISYRTTLDGPTGDFTVYLQLGDVGEDLDEDGILDQELSASAKGFVFNDAANGAALRVGSGPKNEGNNRLDSEDVDGNGFLDPDGSATGPAGPHIVTIPVGVGSISGAAETGWTAFSHSFTPDEKRRLSRARSLRVLVEASGGDSTARLLIDKITLVGSRFFGGWLTGGEITRSDEVTVREIEEWEVSPAPPEKLEDAYGSVDEIFHPFGEKQKVLEVSWKNGAGRTWKARGFTEAQTEGIAYRNIVYYYRCPAMNGTMLTFALEDADGRGVRWSFAPPFASNAWREIRVSVEERKVYRDGVEIPGGVTVDSSDDSLADFSVAAFTVQLEGISNNDARVLYLDELHLTDPRGALGAAATLDLELELPGELVTWGAHPVVHDLSFRQHTAYSSRGFSTLYGTPSPARSFSSASELDFGLSLADLGLDFTAVASGDSVTLGGGHDITVPNIAFPVVFSDSFSLRERDTGQEVRRRNTLRLLAAPLLQLDLESEAGSLEDTLTQSWSADLLVTPAPFTLANGLTVYGAAEDFSPPGSGYFSNWIYGYALLAPWQEGSALERKASLELDWSLDTLPVGAEAFWRYSFHSYDLDAPTRTLRSGLDTVFSLPLVFQDGQVTVFSVKPGYRRTLETVGQEPGSGGYAADFAEAFQTVYGQEYVYNQWPYAELFCVGTERSFLEATVGLEEAYYSAESFVQLSRRFSSRLRDLFVPSSVELAVAKQFQKDGDLTDFVNSYRLTTRSTALNLFGRLGAYPLFDFYRTDEFTTSLDLAFKADRETLRSSEMVLGSYFSFEGEGENAMTVENRFALAYERTVEWDDTVKLLYAWYRYPEGGVRLPLVSAKIEQQGYWSHLESLEVTLSGPQEELSYHPLNIIASHESSVILPDHGQITGELSLGFDVEKTEAGERYWRAGLRGGIEMTIEF